MILHELEFYSIIYLVFEELLGVGEASFIESQWMVETDKVPFEGRKGRRIVTSR